MLVPSAAAASINECATLLPSPTYARCTLLRSPNFSSRVKKSAKAWQGCSRSLSALITGMQVCRAISTMVLCSKVRSTTASTQRSTLRAMSHTGSRSPSRERVWSINREVPPRLAIPASNVRRVRREAFSKNNTSCLPASAPRKSAGRCLMMCVSSNMDFVSSGEKSCAETRSRQSTGCSTGAFMAVRSYILAGIILFVPPGGCRCLCALCQYLFELLHGCIDVVFLDDERRQEPYDSFIGPVHDRAQLEHLLKYLFGRIRGFQFHADHQSLATDLNNRAVFLLQLLQLVHEVITDLLDMLEHLLFFQDSDQLQCDGAGQRASTKCCPVHAGVNACGNFFRGQQRAQWQAAGNRLGHRYEIRLDAVILVGKPTACASHAALDFVGDQQRIVLARELVRSIGKFLAYWTNAAFSLHKLKSNGANSGIKLAFQIGNIVELDKLHSGHNRRKRRAIFFFVSGGQRAKRPAVESMFQGQNPPLWLFAFSAIGLGVSARKFQRTFPGFSAAVGKECAVHAGNLCQRCGQAALILVVKEVRSMHQQLRLLRNRLGQRRMRIAQRIHADAAEQIKVFAALVVIQVNAAAFMQKYGIAVIRRDQQFGFQFAYLLQVHATSTSVPESILAK